MTTPVSTLLSIIFLSKQKEQEVGTGYRDKGHIRKKEIFSGLT